MDMYGAHPLGLNWYRLLSVYSDLGKKSNSSEKICDIGTELQTLKGDMETAIQGISTKLDTLIGAGTNKLSREDLIKLKQAVVDGMKEHVLKSPDQCAAPVVCKDDSVFFTDDVKEVLASLVKQKAAALELVNMSKMAHDIVGIKAGLGGAARMAADIESIKARLDRGIPLSDDDVKNVKKISKWQDVLENLGENIEAGFKAATDRNTPGTDAFTTHQNTLVDAIVTKINPVDSTKTAFRDALTSFFQERASFSDDDKETFADAVLAKLGTTIQLDEKSLQDIVQRVDRPVGFDDELYSKSTEEVLKMFGAKDKKPLLRAEYEKEHCLAYAEYIRDKPLYNSDLTLSKEQIYDHIRKSYTLPEDQEALNILSVFVDNAMTRIANDIGVLQLLQRYLLQMGY